MTDKIFSAFGVSTFKGRTKARTAKDIYRVKVLERNGHEEVNMVSLPQPMTKRGIAEAYRAGVISLAKLTEQDVEAIDRFIGKHL